jgi:putative ribosome biogenesis GTPase RsgA
MDPFYCFNIGVCGHSGNGKTSLINALRGKDDYDEKEAGKVDIIECT